MSRAGNAVDDVGPLSPELARRVEVLIRSRSNVPPNYTIDVGPRTKSDVPGYNEISVNFTADGKSSKPVKFLISEDGRTLAQFSKYDIQRGPSRDAERGGATARGGPASAPVLIVGFDDLECPFCAKMHAELFPAILERYKDQVHIVYRDFPLSQHPWAVRAAVDANCVGAQSASGYWDLVDHIHAHASELGGEEKSLAKANEALDRLARDEGAKQKVDMAALNACVAKQDDSAIKASIKEGESLGVDSTPALFINGEKLEGAYPIGDVFRMIDGALVAQGKTPPPPAAGQLKPETPAASGAAVRQSSRRSRATESDQEGRKHVVEMGTAGTGTGCGGDGGRMGCARGGRVEPPGHGVPSAAQCRCGVHGNGHAIMTTELDKAYASQVGDGPQQPQQTSHDQAEALRLNVLRELIDEEIVQQRAAKMNLTATNEEVDAKLAEMKAPYTEEQFAQRLQQSNHTLDDVKHDLRRSLTIDKL